MDPRKDLLSTNSQNNVQTSQVPCAQLKLEFQDILFSTKYAMRADQFLKSSDNSLSISVSVTDSSSMILDYEDYKGHHALFIEEGIQRLRRIAEMLSSRNDLKDCVQMYIKHRKDIVNVVHMRLREKLNVKSVCGFTYSDELSGEFQRWTQVAKICMGTIFGTEKCFYEQIFGDLGTVEDAVPDCFVYIINEAAAELLKFPDSILASRRLPQRLDILLPLYQELTYLIPNEILFFNKDSRPAKAICNYASGIMLRLKEHMIKILSATEHHVLRELSMNPVPRGGIHPLTEYVINHFDLIYVHRKSLTALFARPQGSNDRDPPEMDELQISLKHHLTRVMDFLLYNLNYKFNFYGQKSLGHFFMMNNVNSVAEKIKSSEELQELFGNQFQMKLREKVELARTDYLNRTWGEVCQFLRGEGSKSLLQRNFFPGSSTRTVKKKLKTFKRMFEDVHQTQAEWIVPDQQLREKLLVRILATLIPAYNHFLGQFSSQIEKMKHPNRYIKYSVTDLETKVLNMFQC